MKDIGLEYREVKNIGSDRRKLPEVGKVTLKSNSNEALSDESP